MSVKNTIKSFVNEFVAMATGDEAKVVAIKVQRSAISALKTRLHNEEGQLYSLEEAVERSEEELKVARFNNFQLIKNSENYTSELFKAINNLTIAKENLENKKLVIVTLENEIEIISTEA